jgi:hypothetical protein
MGPRPELTDQQRQSYPASTPLVSLAPLRPPVPLAAQSSKPGWLSIVASFLSVETDRRGLHLVSKAWHNAFEHLRGYTKQQLADDRAVARRLVREFLDHETRRARRELDAAMLQQSSPRSQLRAIIAAAQCRRAGIQEKRNSIEARLKKLQSAGEQQQPGKPRSPLQKLRSVVGSWGAPNRGESQRQLDALEDQDYDEMQLIGGTRLHLRELDRELEIRRFAAKRRQSEVQFTRWIEQREVPPVAAAAIARELSDGNDAFLGCCKVLLAKCRAGEAIANLDELFDAADKWQIPLDDEERALLLSVIADNNHLKTLIEQLSLRVRASGMRHLATLELRSRSKSGEGKQA